MFLYSQDLSNCTTFCWCCIGINRFLYSQDLSNCTTMDIVQSIVRVFLYSQDLSNCTTKWAHEGRAVSFCTLKI